MSLLERMLERGQSHVPPTQSDTSITPVRAESLALLRVKAMMLHFTSTLSQGDEKGQKLARILGKIADEAIADMADAPAEAIQYHMARSAAIMYWAATGQRILNIPMPEGFTPDPALSVEYADPEIIDAQQRFEIAAKAASDA